MDLEGIMLSKMSHTNTIEFYLYVKSKIKTKSQNRNKLVDIENKLTTAGGEGVGG